MIKPYECTQCGSTDFEDAEAGRVRCTSCGSLFEVLTNEPKVIINQGANVDAEGRVTVFSDVRQRQFSLKKIEE